MALRNRTHLIKPNRVILLHDYRRDLLGSLDLGPRHINWPVVAFCLSAGLAAVMYAIYRGM